MSEEILEGIVSSKARLRIADLLSTRPRTLKELSYLTGISIQGVLKQLGRLDALGLIAETKVRTGDIAVRKLYSIKGARIGDFSQGGLTIVKLSKSIPADVEPENALAQIETLAGLALVQKRRIRDQARKLGRMIEELVENDARLEALVASLNLKDEDRILVLTAFTEESLEDAEKALRVHYGLKDARSSLERAIGNARRVGKK